MDQICEIFMLVCFGASWPLSVRKSWTSRSTMGKSLLFLLLIEMGYIVGLIGKLLFSPSYVVIVYCINIVFVTTDIILFFRNHRYEKARKTNMPQNG